MDTSDPGIVFDSQGVCNHCHAYDRKVRELVHSGPEGAARLAVLVDEMKSAGAGQAYDCVIGVSGGVDSSYVAWQVKALGLRPLAVHLDNGWNSEIAITNIASVLRKMGIDLHTEVLDWEEFKDIQRSFLRASVPDAEVPSDHAIFACLYRTATRFGVRHVITGVNIRTETHMPSAWSRGHFDFGYIADVQRRFGTRKIRSFPHYTFVEYLTGFRRTHSTLNILDYVDYSKTRALQLLQDELGWRDYGGKHFESVYTRWYQGVYLPQKFGFDKRRSHLSSRICSAEVTREFALEEIARPPYDPLLQEQDSIYVAKKLGLSKDEMREIMSAPPRQFEDFESYEKRAASRWFTTGMRALRAARRLVERRPPSPLPTIHGDDIVSALRSIDPQPPSVVMVHSSLSACGTVAGGAETVISALQSWVGDGTLAMPTHSYCYPAPGGPAPTFDVAQTPSVVGVITDSFWRQAGVMRSLHPTHSLAARGPAAGMLTNAHDACDTPCGPGTPYARLAGGDAAVLMFGASMNSYTLFHTAEDAANAPYLYEPQPVSLSLKVPGNGTRTMQMRKHDMRVARSFAERASWLESRGLLRRISLGRGTLLYVPSAAKAHDALVAEIHGNPAFLTAAPTP